MSACVSFTQNKIEIKIFVVVRLARKRLETLGDLRLLETDPGYIHSLFGLKVSGALAPGGFAQGISPGVEPGYVHLVGMQSGFPPGVRPNLPP